MRGAQVTCEYLKKRELAQATPGSHCLKCSGRSAFLQARAQFIDARAEHCGSCLIDARVAQTRRVRYARRRRTLLALLCCHESKSQLGLSQFTNDLDNHVGDLRRIQDCAAD